MKNSVPQHLFQVHWRKPYTAAASILAAFLLLALGARLVVAQSLPEPQSDSTPVLTSSPELLTQDEATQTTRPLQAPRVARLILLTPGTVLVDTGDASGPQPGEQNMPLAQGTHVTTGDNGQAEIELEDGSLARLTPFSTVTLVELKPPTDGWGGISLLRVSRGLVYLEMRADLSSQLRVAAGEEWFSPIENATVRVNVEDPPAVLSVLTGRIQVDHVPQPSASADPSVFPGFHTEVRAGESLRSDSSDPTRYFLAASIPPETWDQWNEARDQAAADELASATPVRNGYAGPQGYGWADLDSSGAWFDQAGQTPIWQPYEALQADFDPYAYGGWTYFNGPGYTWASGYRWGWTPYRCGRWQYWPGFGWAWQPDAFCSVGGLGGFQGGAIIGGPRRFVRVGAPIKHPVGVHPIVPVHPGPHPPYTRDRSEDHPAPAPRLIAGVAVSPIPPVGRSFTTHGGSAAGLALQRDFPVDQRTHIPALGLVSRNSVAAPAQPVSAGVVWQSVATQPHAPAPTTGGFLGFFGHTAHAPGAPSVQVDARGNPYIPSPRNGAGDARTFAPASQPGSGHPQGHSTQSSPSNTQHSSQSSAPAAVHSSPAPSVPAPVASGGKK